MTKGFQGRENILLCVLCLDDSVFIYHLDSEDSQVCPQSCPILSL
jgi:hypothetical protein